MTGRGLIQFIRFIINPMRRLPLMVTVALALLVVQHNLRYASRAVDDYNQNSDETVSQLSHGSLFRQVGLVSLGAAGLAYLLATAEVAGTFFRGSIFNISNLYFVWVVASLGWAEDLHLALVRISSFVLVCLAAAAVSSEYETADLARWTFRIASFYILLGATAELLAGNLAPWKSGYRFAGTLHPNGQGIQCGLLVVAAVYLWVAGSRTITTVLGGSLGFFMLLLTRSRTSLLATAAACAVYLLSFLSKRLHRGTLAALCLVGALGAGILISSGGTIALMQREDDPGTDGSFNGRTVIWEDLAPFIAAHPLAGYGYNAFWTASRIDDMSDREGWGVSAAHSAYLETLLSLGFVGLCAYVGTLVVAIYRCIRQYIREAEPAYLFSLGILLMVVIDGFTDSINLGESLLVFLTMATVIKSDGLRLPRNGAFHQREGLVLG